jgi:hypothetical protein
MVTAYQLLASATGPTFAPSQGGKVTANGARERFTALRRSVFAMMLFSAVPTRANIYSVK